MIFHPTAIPGAQVVEAEPLRDARGHFARTWCRDEFARAAGMTRNTRERDLLLARAADMDRPITTSEGS